jgi:hypothetical protein
VGTLSLEYWEVTLSFTGSVPLQLTSISSTNPSEFPVRTSCPVPGSLAVGRTCTLTVNFRPAGTGTRSSQITIRSSNANTLTLTAFGTGVP